MGPKGDGEIYCRIETHGILIINLNKTRAEMGKSNSNSGIGELTKGVGSAFKQGMNGGPWLGIVALILIAAYLVQKYTSLPIFDWLVKLLEWIGDVLWKLICFVLDLLSKFLNSF